MTIDFNKVPRYILNEIDAPDRVIRERTKNKTAGLYNLLLA